MFTRLESKLREFVLNATRDRATSHGWIHMKSVAETSKKIMADMELPPKQQRHILTVAWLHDVADHKYDKDGSLRKLMSYFICELYPDNYKNVIECIDSISFSRETKLGYKYYENYLAPYWLLVRNVVSDADKIEAIGINGLIRCRDYTQEVSNVKLDDEALLKDVWKHSQEKLLLLYKSYIHTDKGKQIARPLHEDMIRWFISQGISEEQLKKFV